MNIFSDFDKWHLNVACGGSVEDHERCSHLGWELAAFEAATRRAASLITNPLIMKNGDKVWLPNECFKELIANINGE